MSPRRAPRKPPVNLANQSPILPVHKPSGSTSRQIVDEVETRFEDVKIGHGGTLDPLAEGLLPLHFNEATKVVDYLHELNKTYRVRCRFDLTSPSLDLGETVKEVSRTDPPSRQRIQEALQTIEGEQDQVPPKYSAIKLDGKPLYEHARSGDFDEVDEASRSRTVVCKSARILHYDYPALTFRVTCGEGFYVRSMVRDLAGSLDQNGGIVTSLLRTKYGPFELDSAAKLHEPERWSRHVRSLESVLANVPFRGCTEEELNSVVHGGKIPRHEITSERAVAVGPQERAHALLEPDPRNPEANWKPKRVLNRTRP